MQIVSNIALITINETLLVQIVSFLVFLFVINRVLFRPLRRTMDERATYIQKLQAEIEQSESELVKISDQISQQEAATRLEAIDLSKEMEAQGTHEADELSSSAREKVMSRINETKDAVGGQIARAVEDIKSESISLADRIIEKLLDRELS